MKRKILFGFSLFEILIFLSFFLSSSCKRDVKSNEKELNHKWGFLFGNEKLPSEFKDSISVKDFWELQKNIDYDGFAWYSQSIFIPTSIKDNSEVGDSIGIFLGPIDDCDLTYLNDQLIGFNSKSIVESNIGNDNYDLYAAEIKNDFDRIYKLSLDDPRIKFDDFNIIKIKVLDKGGLGGIKINTPQRIYLHKRNENFEIDLRRFYRFLNNKNEDSSFVVSNLTEHDFQGTLKFDAKTLNGEALFYLEKNIFIKKNNKEYFPISLPLSLENVIINISMENDSINFIKKHYLPFILK